MESVQAADHEEHVLLGSRGGLLGGGAELAEDITARERREGDVDVSRLEEKSRGTMGERPLTRSCEATGRNDTSERVSKQETAIIGGVVAQRRTLAAMNLPCEHASMAISLVCPPLTDLS